MNLQNNSINPLEFQNVSQEEKNMVTIMWILSFFTSFIGPLLAWLIKKMNQHISISKEKIA